MSSADERYRAKLAARAAGTTNVTVHPPTAAVDPASGADARFIAKMEARKSAQAQAKASKDAERLLAEATAAEEKAQALAEADKPHGRGHKR
jgi:hypothetical protein